MDTFVVLRRGGWHSPEELQAAADRSSAAVDRRKDIEWIRSYVLSENDGELGTVCVFQAESADSIYRHAAEAGLPVNEVLNVADTVIVREDPAPDLMGG